VCLVDTSAGLNPSQPLSVMLGSVLQNKKMTLQGKLSTCESNFHQQKSSKTLDQGSILRERVCDQSWKDACVVIQSHLLSHTEIGSVGLDSSSLSTLSSKTVEKSWFSTKLNTVHKKNSQKIFSQYFMSSRAECMDLGVTVNKSRKIRIYPTAQQKVIFKQWLDAQRFVYNKTIEYLSKTKVKEHWMKIAKDILADLPIFCKYIPYQVKKIAVKDAFQSFYLNARKVKKQGGYFKLGFKSRRNPKQSCYIPQTAIKDKGIYHTLSGRGLHYSEKLPEVMKDSRLIYHSGRWYLCVPTEVKTTRAESQGRVVAAVDPGIRTFATFFSEDSFGQIGYHDFGRIVRLCHYLDDLLSRMSKATGKRKRAMKRAADRMRWKIKDLVSELHHKTAKFLVDNFDVIFYPTFETSQMATKAARKIGRKSVRSMLTYSFYKFAQHLEHKCFEAGKTLVRVNESYTSKINSFTGKSMNIGSREFFNHDGYRINRDINGARNILCFSLVDTPYVRNHIANVNAS